MKNNVRFSVNQAKTQVIRFTTVAIMLMVAFYTQINAQTNRTKVSTIDGLSESMRYRAEVVEATTLAEIALSRNDSKTALSYYLSLAETTQDKTIAERATEIAIADGYLLPALQAAIVWANNDQANVAAQRTAIMLLLQAEHQTEALTYLASLVENQPEHHNMRLFYAEILQQTKRYQQAREQLQTLTTVSSHRDAAYVHLAVLTYEQDQRDESARWLRRIKDNSKRDQAYYILGQYEEQQQQLQQALRHYHKIGNRDFAFAADVRKAEIYIKLDQGDKALKTLAAIKPSDPLQVKTLVTMQASLLIALQNHQSALVTIKQGLEKIPNDLDFLYAKSMVKITLNEFDTQENDLKFILQYSPNHVESLSMLGFILMEDSDRLAEASEYVEQAQALNPSHPSVTTSVGWLQYRLGNYSEAEKYLRQSHQQQPQNSRIAAHLGEVLWVSGQTKLAEQVWGTALQRTPKHALLLDTIKRLDTKTTVSD